MMLITALVTGIMNVLFLPTGLQGASGIVFMFILLISVTNIKKGDNAFICGYPIEFGSDGQNPHAFTSVSQIAGGKIHPVYPEDAKAFDPNYTPTWKPTWAWLK